jgi:putative adenylate-forming enzyme
MTDALTFLYHYARARRDANVRSRDVLERAQARRFARFASRVLARSPYYRPFAGRPLSAYPLADKRLMMEAFDRINTRGLKRDELVAAALRAEATRDFSPLAGDVSVGLSSGTSGMRGLFVATRGERLQWAAAILAKALREGLRERHRIALLLRANNRLYETVRANGRIGFAFVDLALSFAAMLRALEAARPTVLVGPPHVLALVADARRSGRIALAPQAIFAAGEVLEPQDERAVADAFGVRVDQIYQATEGFLGITCARNVLHLNEEHLIVEREPLGGRRFVPVVTDLRRATQPIVRYRLNDVLVERAEPCPCGAAQLALERIEGREDDVLYVRGASGGVVPMIPDFVRDALAGAYPAVRDYRLIQRNVDSFELRLDAADAARAVPLARAALDAAFARAGAAPPRVELAGPVEHDLLRKARRIERRFALEETAWARS